MRALQLGAELELPGGCPVQDPVENGTVQDELRLLGIFRTLWFLVEAVVHDVVPQVLYDMRHISEEPDVSAGHRN